MTGLAEEFQIIAKNRKAYHDYFVLETYEAGIELYGTEIKSAELILRIRFAVLTTAKCLQSVCIFHLTSRVIALIATRCAKNAYCSISAKL